MTRKIRFKKQYKPIGFGDGPDSRTVEGHQAAMQEAAETRRYNRMMKELRLRVAHLSAQNASTGANSLACLATSIMYGRHRPTPSIR
jgi:hypothetical protein